MLLSDDVELKSNDVSDVSTSLKLGSEAGLNVSPGNNIGANIQYCFKIEGTFT